MEIKRNAGAQQRRKLDMILLCSLFVLYIANKILPAVGHFLPGVLYLGIFGFISLLVLTYYGTLVEDKRIFYITLCFSVSFLMVLQYIFDSNIGSIPNYLYGELQIFLYGAVAVCITQRGSDKIIKNLFWLIMGFYAITAVTTYIGCMKYDIPSRMLATLGSSDYLYQIYTRENIGGFTFIYELVLIVPLLIYMLKTKKMNTVVGILAIVGIGVVIVASEYATAMLLYSIVLLTLLIKKMTVKKILVFAIIAILLFVLLAAPLAGLLDNIADTIPSEALSTRFRDLADTLTGEDMKSDATSQNRIELYGKSWEAFASSLGLGSWSNNVGGHSYVLDALGKYGFLGIFALVLLYFGVYQLALKPHKDESFFGSLFLVYVLSIVLAFINTKTNLFILICLLPLFSKVMGMKEDEEKDS